MEKYYGAVKYGQCVDRCKVMNDDTMIGSVACQECSHCTDSDDNEEWIICDVIDKAK